MQDRQPRSLVEREVKNRINIAVYAYAYEFKNDSLVSDAEFDKLAKEINPQLETGNILLDRWFQNNYKDYTGQWIHTHPDRAGLERVYNIKIKNVQGRYNEI